MARAKICDLCETYYKPYNENSHDYPNAIRLVSTSEDEYVRTVKKYDLCPDCLVAIGMLIERRKHPFVSVEREALKKKFNLPVVESVEGE